jgi:hypothetical protein
MGLTIHYQLKTSLTEVEDIRLLVESLRQVARDLPFKEVGDLLEFQGAEADYQQCDRKDPHRWLKIQAGQHVKEGERYFHVDPLHIVAFSTWPGEGCEEANFGLCRYPAHVTPASASGSRRAYATGLDGWRWSSFCKTQYASDPQLGGVSNFLRCHLCVVKLLDFAKATKLISVDVNDEGAYWEKRDLKKLAGEVGNWNEIVAGLAGMFQDAARSQGMATDAAIAGFPNFEHLEAKGLAKLKKLRTAKKQE